MMTSEFIQALSVISVFSLVCVVLGPVFYWVLALNPKDV